MSWSLYKPDSIDADLYKERIRNLAEKCNTYPFLIQILVNRNYSDYEIEKILLAPIELLPKTRLFGSIDAGNIIIDSLEKNENIAIFADYDCDGITSGYVMADGLRKVRDALKSISKVIVYYPERIEGYGLSLDFAKRCVNKNISLVITVDNGISALEPTIYLKKNNIKVIITDHHPFSSNENCMDIFKYADAVVNPATSKEDTDRSYLAGVGVAWDVLKSITCDIKPDIGINANNYIDIVATGTISDVMPMSAENMAIVKLGLFSINNVDTSSAFLKEYKKDNLCLTTKDISWTIAPEINAAGRIDSVWIAAKALFDNIDVKKNVSKLGRINYKRKQLTETVMDYFHNSVILDDDRFIICKISNQNPVGLLGIIAGKMMDYYPLYPCFACVEDLSDGVLRGSVRCNPIVPLKQILSEAKNNDLIISYAGHDSACVLNIEAKKERDFVKFFNEKYNSLDITLPDIGEAILYYDYESTLSFVNENFMKLINSVPYGSGFEPVIRINNLLVTESRQTTSGGGFLKLSDNTTTKRVFVFKDMFEKYLSIGKPKQIDILGTIEQDFMAAKPRATIRIADIRISHSKME